MYCPRCGRRHPSGVEICPDCRVALVEHASGDEPSPDADDLDLVTVVRTGNLAIISLAKSILESADLPFMTKGEGLQDLLGAGRLGSGYNMVFGPVEILVRAGDVDEAEELLADLREDIAEEDPGEMSEPRSDD